MQISCDSSSVGATSYSNKKLRIKIQFRLKVTFRFWCFHQAAQRFNDTIIEAFNTESARDLIFRCICLIGGGNNAILCGISSKTFKRHLEYWHVSLLVKCDAAVRGAIVLQRSGASALIWNYCMYVFRIAPGVVPCLLFTYSLAHVSRVHAADTTLQKVFASKEKCSRIGAAPKHNFRCSQVFIVCVLAFASHLAASNSHHSKVHRSPTHTYEDACCSGWSFKISKSIIWVQKYNFNEGFSTLIVDFLLDSI